MRTHILATGSALPARCVTNADLAAQGVDTTDAWVRERTGIAQRYVAANGETTATLATRAAQAALARAGLTAADLDLVIVATSTPDYSFPSVGTQVQASLGMTRGAAFDVQAVCSGFVYALSVADSLLAAGHGTTAVVIGAETFSKLLDWNDRTTCVLFGDGAGAVVVRRQAGERGLLDTKLYSDGRHLDLLRASGGVATTATAGHVLMNGREVYKHAVRAMADMVTDQLSRHGYTVADLDWLVPHQANARILSATAEHAKLPAEKVIVTIDLHANTSAASIPLALDVAAADGRLKPGQLVLLEAFGAGFTWASALLRW
jgi:3-oxoacyl-[acyl-carrier-protein] synthase-3